MRGRGIAGVEVGREDGEEEAIAVSSVMRAPVLRGEASWRSQTSAREARELAGLGAGRATRAACVRHTHKH